MSNRRDSQPWSDFFQEPENATVDRSSISLQQGIMTEAKDENVGADNDANFTLSMDDVDLGEYEYDYDPSAVSSSQDHLADSSYEPESSQYGPEHDSFQPNPYEQPIDESKLNKSIAKTRGTQRRKSRNADLSQAFNYADDTDENDDDVYLPDGTTNPNGGAFSLDNATEDDFYEPRKNEKVPIWRQFMNLACMAVSVVLLPWMCYSLFILFWVSFGIYFQQISPLDVVLGIGEIGITVVGAAVFGLLWNLLSVVACRMWIRRVVLPALYILTLLTLGGMVTFLILAWTSQTSAKYAWGFVLFYILVLVVIIPVWILRFIRQEYMLRFFARRILVLLWNHKIVIPMMLLCVLLQGTMCLMAFVFTGYPYVTIPLCLIAMDTVRNCLLYAICRMDRHFLEEGKSNATLSISYFLEASVFRLFWIVMGTILSFATPLIVATRSIALAILTACVSYNYALLWAFRVLIGEPEADPQRKRQKTIIAVVLGLLFGLWIILGIFVSIILTLFSILYYIMSELSLVIISRGNIASMGFFQENWFRAVWRQVKIRLRGAFFTSHPLSSADTYAGKAKCLCLKLVASISEVSEANNVLLYFSEMGALISASLCGITAFWWLNQIRNGPVDPVAEQFHPAMQGLLVCFCIGYYLTSTIIQCVDARVHTLCLCMKHPNNNLLSKFTKIEKADLDTMQDGGASKQMEAQIEDDGV
uniref:Uncharacterized protein n=1 Tax=Percolomonas cosmopolitus TaxID=63605 RepID=A0A7S1PF44_9EUKA|mmetsp:Transcript_10536/g.39166  ORF Transcript_10536/g.39166 Transcript_10536/m.39166 type:complete len:703 (+) Transcript_10536:225-2333(+)|eukprot:CAMPEP_0117435742 /NCGR_PEP_ID=MMETSP0759-20121206/639_1 /TAXON_ID=63605 /ORGANISM="Percolomonas cosmopolitus, Strain WS" /LENGTH=702 /DNA_ID=CAMNT_0005227301 /DNA_START=135 /DNA_END=2243 /DNA_ORIENTATION=+